MSPADSELIVHGRPGAAPASAHIAAVPTGFVPVPLGTEGGFIPINGPLFGKNENGKLVLGFRVEKRHSNPMGFCHGGMLMTFADMQLPIAAQFQENLDCFLPTVTMSADFLAPAPLGAWIEGRAEVLKTTRNLVFAQALITADGAPVMRASGTFKRGPAFEALGWKPDLRGLLA